MKLRRFLPLLLLLCLSFALFARPGAPPVADEGFSIFMLLFAAVAICAFAGVAIIGSLIAVLFFIVFAVMVFSGILSASLLAGWYRRSVMRGVRVFVYLCTAFLGACFAAGISVLAGTVFHWDDTVRLLVLGSAGGALGGLVLGWVILRAVQVTYRLVVRTGRQP